MTKVRGRGMSILTVLMMVVAYGAGTSLGSAPSIESEFRQDRSILVGGPPDGQNITGTPIPGVVEDLQDAPDSLELTVPGPEDQPVTVHLSDRYTGWETATYQVADQAGRIVANHSFRYRVFDGYVSGSEKSSDAFFYVSSPDRRFLAASIRLSGMEGSIRTHSSGLYNGTAFITWNQIGNSSGEPLYDGVVETSSDDREPTFQTDGKKNALQDPPSTEPEANDTGNRSGDHSHRLASPGSSGLLPPTPLDHGGEGDVLLGEAGIRGSMDDAEWNSVSLDVTVDGTPLGFATTQTARGGQDPSGAQIRDLDVFGFETQHCEWDPEDACDNHAAEDNGWLVAGSLNVDGITGMEAGTLDVDNDDNVIVPFDQTFESQPLVFAQVQTENGGQDSLNVQVHDVQTDSFHLEFCEQDTTDGCDNSHTTETVAWWAIDPNLYEGDTLDWGTTWVDDSNWNWVSFSDQSFSSAPAVIAMVQTENGAQEALYPEVKGVTTDGAYVRYCESDANDECDTHNREKVAWLAAATGRVDVHSGGCYESIVRFDVEERYIDGEGSDWFDKIQSAYEDSVDIYENVEICLDKYKIVKHGHNIISSRECNDDEYTAADDYSDWLDANNVGPSYVNAFQLVTGLDLHDTVNNQHCYGVAFRSELNGPNAASVVEFLDHSILDPYDPSKVEHRRRLMSHELGHLHGSFHYSACDDVMGCNIMHSTKWYDGDWWTSGSENDISSFAYPRLG